MAALPLPTLQQVQAEVLATHLDAGSAIFEQLNLCLFHVNRLATLLGRIGENYHHRRWALWSDRARGDVAYMRHRGGALSIVYLMGKLFNITFARRLFIRAHARPEEGRMETFIRLLHRGGLERNWLNNGQPPRWDMAMAELMIFLNYFKSDDLENGLGVGGHVRQSSRSTLPDPVQELHNSRLYKHMLNIRAGTIVYWRWLQKLAQCRDESPPAERFYFLIAQWIYAFMLFAPLATQNTFAPTFIRYFKSGAVKNRVMTFTQSPGEKQALKQFVEECPHLEVRLLVDGPVYQMFLEPVLSQCTRALHTMTHVQQRMREWYWRPADENPDGTYDINTAGPAARARLEHYRAAHSE